MDNRITYEDIERVNGECKTSPIKDKSYIEVNERIKAFRKLFPDGFINTEIISNENGVCVIMAGVGVFTPEGEKRFLATGTAYEKEDSTFINKTSYIENCETSAVGRALGMLGIGIDTSIASADEVANAIINQSGGTDTKKATPKQIEFLKSKYVGENLEKLLKANNLEKLEDMSITKASELIGKLKGENK